MTDESFVVIFKDLKKANKGNIECNVYLQKSTRKLAWIVCKLTEFLNYEEILVRSVESMLVRQLSEKMGTDLTRVKLSEVVLQTLLIVLLGPFKFGQWDSVT